MSPEGTFAIYCLEKYKNRYQISGAEAATLFTENGVWDYLIHAYGALHTFGDQYILEDLAGFIEEGRQETPISE